MSNVQDKEAAKELYKPFTKQNTLKFSLNNFKCWARVVDIYDGDTITVVLSYRDNCYKFSVRLLGINANEIRNKNSDEKRKAILARDRLARIILQTFDDEPLKEPFSEMLESEVYLVWLECCEFDAFGRILGWAFLGPEQNKSINDILLEEGFVEPFSR